MGVLVNAVDTECAEGLFELHRFFDGEVSASQTVGIGLTAEPLEKIADGGGVDLVVGGQLAGGVAVVFEKQNDDMEVCFVLDLTDEMV